MSEEFIGAAALTSRYVLAFVLLTTAVPKLLDAREFERAVSNYALLPPRFVRPVAVWLPRFELAVGLALLLGVAVEPFAAFAGLLLLVFAIAVVLNLRRGRRIDCGCYSSVAPRSIGWWLVAGDLALASMALTVVLADPGVLALVRLESSTSASLGSEDGVAILMLATVLVLGQMLVSSGLSLRASVDAFSRRQEEGTAL